MAKPPDMLPVPDLAKVGQRSPWLFRAAVVVLIGLSLLVVIERNRIRAYWWAWQLTRTDDAAAQAYYVGSLSAVGDAATDAVERLARDERPEIRSLSIIVLARLPHGGGVNGLGTLLGDRDQDVAESAALSLAFIEGGAAAGQAQRLLIDAVASDDSRRACAAAAALSRVNSEPAIVALANAARRHAEPLVRAQAIESLAASLGAGRMTRQPLPPPTAECDPLGVLVAALSDEGTFTGGLSLERQMASASGFAGARTGVPMPATEPATLSAGRTVGDVAAENLARLTGQPIEPRETWTPEEQAQVLKQCREALGGQKDKG